MSKVALVTGGTKGLGKEIVNYLLRNDWKVCTCGRNTEYITKDNYMQFPCNITAHSEVSPMISHMMLQWGRIDLVINNAGNVILKPFEQYTENDYEEIFASVKGMFLVSKFVIAFFQCTKGGRIINIGSTRSITVAPNKSLYSASKFAIRALNKALNLEFNSNNIYASLICPGAIDFTGQNKTKVQVNEIIQAIEKIITLPAHTNIEEMIIGGQL